MILQSGILHGTFRTESNRISRLAKEAEFHNPDPLDESLHNATETRGEGHPFFLRQAPVTKLVDSIHRI